MSQFKDTSDDTNVICPYCLHKYQPESEDFDQDVRREVCEECEKEFWLSQEFSVSHRTKPDCEINGLKHTWESVYLRTTGRNHDFCNVCDKCRPIRDMEKGK